MLIDFWDYVVFFHVNVWKYKTCFQPNGTPRTRWRLAPTRREQEKWDRAAKAATGGSVSSPCPIAVQKQSVVSSAVNSSLGECALLINV